MDTNKAENSLEGKKDMIAISVKETLIWEDLLQISLQRLTEQLWDFFFMDLNNVSSGKKIR